MNTLPLGQVFTLKGNARKWSTADGLAGVHDYTLRARVTATDERGFSWETLSVEDESGRPPADIAFTPEHGTTAWFALPLYLDNGRMTLV